MTGTAALILGLLTGLVTGATLAWAIALLRGRRLADAAIRAEARVEQLEERLDDIRSTRAEMGDAFKALGAETLQSSNKEFLRLAGATFETLMVEARGDAEKRQQAAATLMGGVREMLEKQNLALTEIEKQRAAERSGLETRLKRIAEDHNRLGAATDRLVSALRRPNQRGRWGEMQLRNVVEVAGMIEHCDFDLQPTVRNADAHVRPDLVVRLPGGGHIVVDAKTPMDAFLESLEDDADCERLLRKHADQFAVHMKSLANKRYWEQFERSPKLVVMFVPLEPALARAMEVNPGLQAEGMRDHVLIATPTLLVALLRAVAYGWQQEDVAANAQRIAKTGRDLYDRIGKFTQHFARVADGLRTAGDAYNRAVGSLERRVLPAARDLRELHVSTDKLPPTPGEVKLELREVKPMVEGGEGDGPLTTEGNHRDAETRS